MSRSGADFIQGGARSIRTSVYCGNGMNVAFLQRSARAPWPAVPIVAPSAATNVVTNGTGSDQLWAYDVEVPLRNVSI
jgi:hypothetical protein